MLIRQVLFQKGHALKIIPGAEKTYPFHKLSTYVELVNLWWTVVSANFQISIPERMVAHAVEKSQKSSGTV